jgi:ABC-type multidrug transport system ATPase subunit
MSLLILHRVTVRLSVGRRECTALKDVSLDIAPGELVGVRGMRRSGRTTLLRVASGMLPPDEGVVSFDGRDLATHRDLLGTEIGYCNREFHDGQGGTVEDHVAVPLLARGVPVNRAHALATEALARTGARDCADLDPRDLHPHELMRSAIARTLVLEPRILLVDEPTSGVDLEERDPLLALLRSLAEEGIGVLMTIGETLAGLDRTLHLDEGELRGNATPSSAPVVPLRQRAEPAG